MSENRNAEVACIGCGCTSLILGWCALGFAAWGWIVTYPGFTFPHALRIYWPQLLCWFVLSCAASILITAGKAASER